MRGIRLGRVLGFEISIDYSWFLVVALIVWSLAAGVFPVWYPGLRPLTYLIMGTAAALFFFASLLAHELAHSVVARRRGIEVDGITLFIFGGIARTRSEAERPGDELAIAAAGPLMSIALSALLWGAGNAIGRVTGWGPVATVASYLSFLNLLLALFNLLPGFPMDGGRIFRAIAWRLTGNLTKATRWATTAGRGLGWLMIALGIAQAVLLRNLLGGMWLAFIGWFIGTAARSSYRQHLLRERLRTGADGESMIPEFVIPSERLPPGFADSVGEPVDQPAPARPAATIVLMRDGARGPEVLLLKRHRSSGFVPGAYVFPGGRVDDADATSAAAGRIAGWSEPPPASYVVAAVREAFEETGILIGGARPGADLGAWRERLLAEATDFAAAAEACAGVVDVSDVVYFAHWITPEAEPRRYDTRFFLARVPAGAEAAPDPREIVDAVWLRPEEALAAFAAGRLPMVFPTVRTLEALAGFASVAEALAAHRGRAVQPVLPRLVRMPNGVGIVTGGSA